MLKREKLCKMASDQRAIPKFSFAQRKFERETISEMHSLSAHSLDVDVDILVDVHSDLSSFAYTVRAHPVMSR